MKINALQTNHGQTITLGPFTVLVGANNVGKSQTLRDIHAKMVNGLDARTTLASSVSLTKPGSIDEVFRGLTIVDDPIHVGHKRIRGITANLIEGDEIQIHEESFAEQFASSVDGSVLLGTIGRFRVSFLDASSRLSVASATGAYNPHTTGPQRLLQGLFAAGLPMEAKLRKAFRNTFGMDIRLDYSGMTELALRVAREFPRVPDDPRAAYPVMKEFHRLDEQGDGFRSFVGVVLSLILSEGRVILLDEPEAFLHPAQARRLGYWVAEYAQKGSGQIIVATHNANFLAGILSRGVDVDIFRLNRYENTTTYNKITATAISKLARSPLLSSQSILEAVFHSGVAVCEADSDRAVYQTVAIRELQNQNVLFLHAQSKQTVKEVVGLLKEATIPVAAVVDFDILNSSSELEKLLRALAPEPDIPRFADLQRAIAADIEGRTEGEILQKIVADLSELSQQLEKGEHTVAGARSALKRIFGGASKWSKAKKHGIEALRSELHPQAHTLLTALEHFGLFVVPVGELEGWLDVGTRKKNRWIVLALEELFNGTCPVILRDFVHRLLLHLGEDVGSESANQVASDPSMVAVARAL